MGYYLQIDQKDMEPIASIVGWGEAIDWAKQLSQADYGSIRHLFRYGWEDDIDSLVKQFAAALEDAAPKNPLVLDTVGTIGKLIAANPGAKVVTVTDGLGTDGE